MSDSTLKKLLTALAANWKAEMDGCNAYTALAAAESDPHRRNAVRGLAFAEQHHADLWAGRIRQLGGPVPKYSGHSSGQADSLAKSAGGPDLALRRLEIDEGRDIAKYGKTLKALGDEPSVAILEESSTLTSEAGKGLPFWRKMRAFHGPEDRNEFSRKTATWSRLAAAGLEFYR